MNTPTEQIIQKAISETKAGNKEAAKKALSQVVRQEPNNAFAWYLLSQVVEKKEQAIDCLERVLKLQPENQQAKEYLKHLKGSDTKTLRLPEGVRELAKSFLHIRDDLEIRLGELELISYSHTKIEYTPDEFLEKIKSLIDDTVEYIQQMTKIFGDLNCQSKKELSTEYIESRIVLINTIISSHINIIKSVQQMGLGTIPHHLKILDVIKQSTIDMQHDYLLSFITFCNQFSNLIELDGKEVPSDYSPLVQLTFKPQIDTSKAIELMEKFRSDEETINLSVEDLLAQTPWHEAYAMGEKYYYGLDENIQDIDEALSLFKQAAKLGCPTAYWYIGKIYSNLENNKKALEYFKEGVSKEDERCWAEMAIVFFSEGHQENEEKCWNKYFSSKCFKENITYGNLACNRAYYAVMYIHETVIRMTHLNIFNKMRELNHKDELSQIKSEVGQRCIELIDLFRRAGNKQSISDIQQCLEIIQML